jgi:hypothetical protein
VRRPIPALHSNAERLARAVLLFYAPTWNDGKRRLWGTLTRTDEATPRTLCRLARRILAEEAQPSKLKERVLEATELLAAYHARMAHDSTASDIGEYHFDLFERMRLEIGRISGTPYQE